MSALQKLKAYFGMVPADEMDDYEDERYGDYAPSYQHSDSDFDTYGDRVGRRRLLDSARPVSGLASPTDGRGFETDDRPRGRRPWTAEPPQRTVAPVRGALAVEPQVEPPVRTRPPVPEQAPQPVNPLSKITTLHPRSYLEARTIGEHYRDGIPVIMNLTDLDNADAKRLIDFAAGLVFALRGSMDKVTNRVFLISPPDIDVTAEDRRRLAEGGF